MRFGDDLRFSVGHGGEIDADGDLENQKGEVGDQDVVLGSIRAGGEQANAHSCGNLIK